MVDPLRCSPAEVSSIPKPWRDDRLLRDLGARLAELGFLKLERMEPGAEATALTKVIAQGEFVLKAIDEQKAQEEVRQILRIEQCVPSFFPRLLHTEADAGHYAIEYVAGAPLEVALASTPLPKDASHIAPRIIEALELLRKLHLESARTYSGRYHDVIVHHRASEVPRCGRIAGRYLELFTDSPKQSTWSATDIARRLETMLDSVRTRYEEVLPCQESLIHGDPHLGNIIAKRDGGVCFIDPRVTWDGIRNPTPGYFDPLYDPACVAHSLIAKSILDSISGNWGPHPQAALIEESPVAADILLDRYLRRHAHDAERTRFRIYIGCALLGNLRYSEWTPNSRAFDLTLRAAMQMFAIASS